MRNFIILVLLLTLFYNDSFASNIEIDTLSSNNKINIGVFKDEAPYAFIDDNGQLDGFSIDIIKAIMNKAELDYQFDVYDRNRDYDKSHLIADSLLKKSDVGVSFVPNMELKKRYYFSDPYTILAFKIIAPDTIAYGGMRDLYNKDIIVKRGSSAHGQIIHFGVPLDRKSVV